MSEKQAQRPVFDKTPQKAQPADKFFGRPQPNFTNKTPLFPTKGK